MQRCIRLHLCLQEIHCLDGETDIQTSQSGRERLHSVYAYVLSHAILFELHHYSPPGSSVHGISQARILEWVATCFSRGSPWPKDQTHNSCTAGRFFTAEPLGKAHSTYTKVWDSTDPGNLGGQCSEGLVREKIHPFWGVLANLIPSHGPFSIPIPLNLFPFFPPNIYFTFQGGSILIWNSGSSRMAEMNLGG